LAVIVFFLLQNIFCISALALGVWLGVPKLMLIGIGGCWLAIILSALASVVPSLQSREPTSALLLLATLILFGGLVFNARRYHPWTLENAALQWLVAGSVLLQALNCKQPERKTTLLRLFLVWASGGSIVWLAAAYLANLRLEFYLGLLPALALLVMLKKRFRLNALAIQAVNTLMLLLVGLPIVSLFFSPDDQFDMLPKLEERPYSFEFAKRNPSAFARWSKHSTDEFKKFTWAVTQGGDGVVRLRPNMIVPFFEARIPINSKGFRGREIPEDKGDAYRIVTLGESTTFGLTMRPGEKPWPEMLEQFIMERLKPGRAVQIINAGIPGYNLKQNIERLEKQILPLRPDMIISYHGLNGFAFVFEGMPEIQGRPPPGYQRRPLTLLADFEYRVKMNRYRRQYEGDPKSSEATDRDPMQTQYAQLYRQLIQIAKTNGIRLALGTYSMAVNPQSPAEVFDFYNGRTMRLEWQVKANAIHSAIARKLAAENPDIHLVDTCPALDGRHEYFFDLVHFTAEGKKMMAEVMYEGIKDELQRSLKR
jgi:lysophospholipase L1-like esterase